MWVWAIVGVVLLGSGGMAAQRSSGPMEGVIDAKAYGAKADGVTDDTQAIQNALNEAGKVGGVVYLPPGRYLVKGSLRVPVGVSLKGAAEAPLAIEPLIGTVVMATGGRDNEDAKALFELGKSASVIGLTVFYPDQKPDDIHPYPWTFHMFDIDNTIENVTLINSYNGIRVGPEPNCRHRIRSVYGCVLRRGILVDNCTDIGRIDNVQFHCHWWSAKSIGGNWDRVFEYMWRNCEAFIFGRTDWEYVNNTFVFPVNTGYKFVATKAGACNGQFSGIGSDASQICVLVQNIQRQGLLITNGQFVAFNGENPIEVVIEKTCTGSVRLVNCAFWGTSMQNAVSHGQGYLSLSDCYISSWRDFKDAPGKPMVEADDGKLQVRGCTFAGRNRPAVGLRKGLKHAIITENNGDKGVSVTNEVGDSAIIANNEPPQ
jgi:hypothetical protein